MVKPATFDRYLDLKAFPERASRNRTGVRYRRAAQDRPTMDEMNMAKAVRYTRIPRG